MDLFNLLQRSQFDLATHHHAEAILRHDMPDAAAEIEQVLIDLVIPIDEIIRGGGGEGQLTQRLRRALADQHGWRKHNFEIKKIVDGIEKESTSHEIDHVKQFNGWTFALEIEWNNKDPFFDRDLENFKRLHAEGAISLGCIITRGQSLQENMCDLVEAFAVSHQINDISRLPDYLRPTARQRQLYQNAAKRFESFEKGWAHAFVSDKFGQATTHWNKLIDRVQRGVGNPCPLLLIGIPSSVVRPA